MDSSTRSRVPPTTKVFQTPFTRPQTSNSACSTVTIPWAVVECHSQVDILPVMDLAFATSIKQAAQSEALPVLMRPSELQALL